MSKNDNASTTKDALQLELFARCASGFEHVLAQELKALGAQRVRPLKGGVSFFGTLEDAYRACLWSRVAMRIQLVLARVGSADADALYQSVRAFAWEDQVPPGATIAVRAHGQNRNLRNTQFTALKVKDAMCDHLREVCGKRPNVDAEDPDFSVDISLNRERATLYLNLSGASQHRRGYRQDGVQGAAPLKETLAAGMLLAAGYPAVGGLPAAGSADGLPAAGSAPEAAIAAGFVDPMCGSGTLAIEAALIASDSAPGLLRQRWGFVGWQRHDPDLWERIRAQAEQRKAAGLAACASAHVLLVAGDSDPHAIELARANAQRAGVAEIVDFHVSDAGSLLAAATKVDGAIPPAGLLATNPPYGQRLLSSGQLPAVYAALGKAIEGLPRTWDVAIITPDAGIDAALGEVPTRELACYNGPIEASVRLYCNRQERTKLPLVSLQGRECSVSVAEANSAQFAARLRKVAKERTKWARKAGVSCYCIYDADLPDYALSVDLFHTCAAEDGAGAGAGEVFARVVEYQAPASIDPLLADRRFMDALAIVPAVLDLDSRNVFSKVRKRAKGGGQYADARGESKVVLVEEAGYVFELDLGGYLDTGLFLDHRATRGMVGQKAGAWPGGARFLNLFAYTGTATVHAAGGGACATTTVDLSHTYLDWAQRNMQRNGFTGPEHAYERADVLEWLDGQSKRGAAFDLIFCDPPTFSNSKAIKHAFDVQRDHVELLRKAARVLAPGGTIVFSCNLRSFKLDEAGLANAGLAAEDITADTIPHDFARTPKIHRCYLVRALTSG